MSSHEKEPPQSPETTPGYSNQIFQTNSSLPSQPLQHPIRPQTSADAPLIRSESHGHWLPIPLRNWFAIPLIVSMGVEAVAVELLWYYNKQAGGWGSAKVTSESEAYHYVYTLPPVVTAIVITGLWGWTDGEVKRLQPYAELFSDKGASPQKSLLLDYTRTHNFFVWRRAMANGHHVVVLTTIIAICCLALSPLASALLILKDTMWSGPSFVNNLAEIGLNTQNSEFQDLTIFLTSAGYASAFVMFGLGNATYISNNFTISPFEIPSIGSEFINGSVILNTSAVLTDPGCRAADATTTNEQPDNSWINTATFGTCLFQWSVNNTAQNLFGADLASNCTEFSSRPPWFQPVVFWGFTYLPTPLGSVVMCQPSITLWDVTVEMDLATHNISSITQVGPFVEGTSSFSGSAGNVTALGGQAYNGIRFDVSTSTDPFVLQREQAIQFLLPAAIFQAMQTSPQGLFPALGDGSMVELSSQVYSVYLSLAALQIYFLDNTVQMPVTLEYIRKLVWFSPPATHTLAADLTIIFLLGLAAYFLHRPVSASLRLRYEPRNIAAAVSMAGGKALGSVLAGVQREEEFSTRLQDTRFRLNPDTMRIIMEGEPGYEEAPSPPPRPVSMFAKMVEGPRQTV